VPVGQFAGVAFFQVGNPWKRFLRFGQVRGERLAFDQLVGDQVDVIGRFVRAKKIASGCGPPARCDFFTRRQIILATGDVHAPGAAKSNFT